MKKIISIIGTLALGCVLLGTSASFNEQAQAGLNDIALTAEYSNMLADSYENVNDFYMQSFSEDNLSDEQKDIFLDQNEVFEIGENIAISKQEVQQYTDFYLNEGMDEKEAYQLAVKDAEERNALYVEAIKNGYSVTDEEIYEWLDQLKEMLENDTTGVYEAALSGFESEDAYWDYEFEVYKIDLPIQKYVSDQREQYYLSNPQSTEDTDSYNDWHDAFEQLKHNLAESQNFESAE